MNLYGKVTLATNTGRSVMTAAIMIVMMLGLLTQTGCATSAQTHHDPGDHHASHQHHASDQHHTASDSVRSALTTPSAIVIEHEHLHHQLDAAIASGGTTGQRAREVAAILQPHFEQEEAYAMPPLGLLEALAWNQPLDEATINKAIKMADHLRAEYANMVSEHKTLTTALHKLVLAAKAENKPEQAAFADALIMHAQHEEQVLYPATLLIGQYLRLKQQTDKATHAH